MQKSQKKTSSLLRILIWLQGYNIYEVVITNQGILLGIFKHKQDIRLFSHHLETLGHLTRKARSSSRHTTSIKETGKDMGLGHDIAWPRGHTIS